MCGIAGIFNTDLVRRSREVDIRRMTGVLAHRGPDGEGFYVDGPIAFGHRRLSIIDVEGGAQPIFNEDRTVAIVFNGEIYNFRTVREDLVRRGYRFSSHSDTEVILHAYEELGEKCVHQLRGMFAFAIWDARRRELFLARDRVGIKPLYYYFDGTTFLFSSEIKGLLEHPAVRRTLDLTALDDFLTYLYIPGPKTIFREIRKLRAGHTLTVSDRGLEEREYWDVSFAVQRNGSESDYAEVVREKLRECVATHLVSDVPLGAFLSGGIDSSAVVAMMASVISEPVRTASIGFTEEQFDELRYARLVARQCGADGDERVVTADAAEILDTLVWHFDEPFADSSMVPTFYLSGLARERVTVCLSGDGGDENFGGYRRYRFDVLESRMRRLLPGPLRSGLIGPLGRLYPKADWLPRPLRAKSLLTNLALPAERAYYRTMSWFTPAMKERLYRPEVGRSLSGYDSFAAFKPHFDRSEGWDPLSRIQYVDIKTYLVDDILTKVDRASMAHSLEARVPLLDHEFIELAAGIPAHYKLRRGEGKYIFKRAMLGLVPEAVLRRSKMGFAIPLARWFRGRLRSLFEEQVFADEPFLAGLVDQATIRAWWIQHQRGIRNFGPHLWALLVLEAWGRRFGR